MAPDCTWVCRRRSATRLGSFGRANHEIYAVPVLFAVQEEEIRLDAGFIHLEKLYQPLSPHGETTVSLTGQKANHFVRVIIELPGPFPQQLAEDDRLVFPDRVYPPPEHEQFRTFNVALDEITPGGVLLHESVQTLHACLHLHYAVAAEEVREGG